MKCVVLMSDKMAGIPIFECGGVHLAPGEKLIVKKEWADSILSRYKHVKMVQVEVIEKQKLHGGHYEILKKEKPSEAKAPLESHELLESPENKSMQSSPKVKRK